MELKKQNKWSKQRGTSLIELMIACLVLMVGVAGTVTLIPIAIGANSRNRQQSNSTVISQMVAEKISSQKASLSNNLTITDCAGNSTTVYTAAGGATLTSAGDADYTQAALTGYQMDYTDCGTNGRLMIYDVRWNITQPTGYVKLITVSTKMKNAGTNARVFALPVTIRTLVGQGT